MKKVVYLLSIPFVVFPFLTSCNNSVRWISKEEFKEKVNDFFPSKPFEKYVGCYFAETYEGEPISDKRLITDIDEHDGIYQFASKSGETTTTFWFTVLSPNLADYNFGVVDIHFNVIKCGITNSGNFILRVEQKMLIPEYRVVNDIDYIYNKDLVVIHASSTQRVGDKKYPTISTDWIYEKNI